jgi:hypothetical protein
MIMDDIEAKQMAEDIREIKQAVLGDPGIGLNGLVGDMKEMKDFRSNLTVKVAATSGVVAGGILGFKALIVKLLGP